MNKINLLRNLIIGYYVEMNSDSVLVFMMWIEKVNIHVRILILKFWYITADLNAQIDPFTINAVLFASGANWYTLSKF